MSTVRYSLPTYTGVKVVHGSPKRFGTAASWSMTGRSEIGSFTQQVYMVDTGGLLPLSFK